VKHSDNDVLTNELKQTNGQAMNTDGQSDRQTDRQTNRRRHKQRQSKKGRDR